MREIKLGQINFYLVDNKYDSGVFRIVRLCEQMNQFAENMKFVYCDCTKEECDIVFYSLYNKLENLKNVKGHPIMIYWTDEHMCIGPDQIYDNPFEHYRNGNLSISFYDDSDTNVFYPYFFNCYHEYLEIVDQFKTVDISKKTKFATFCASNSEAYHAQFRTNAIKHISDNYKQITCCGAVLNNTNGEYLPWDLQGRFEYHRPYKFYMSFENHESSGNINYLTEKILNGFIYHTVPVYWGSERVNEIINPNSFINVNGCTYDEMIEKIKFVDEHNDMYEDMLNTYPFVADLRDLVAEYGKKIYKLIKNLLNIENYQFSND